MRLNYSKQVKPVYNFQYDIKLSKERKENTVKCKCGHSVFIPVFKDDLICHWCGYKVINTTKNHFKYKLRKVLKCMK